MGGKKVVAYGCNGEEELGSERVWLCTVVMVEEPWRAACSEEGKKITTIEFFLFTAEGEFFRLYNIGK